jgi:serine/threonine-protein kinase
VTSVRDSFEPALAERYRIERELGSGGMATVFLAEDVRHHRKVALKVLHPELSAVLGPERFLKEIELTASLQHPHILPLFDSGSADSQLFYVMPFVEGETLRSRLERERQLPIADALRIAREVADALQYAHERGVIHRDIKPENILLQRGHALVADFGIALAVQHAGGQRMTQTGLSLGTPQYMAPEQAMGEKAVDARADVYALGAVLYEMLTGEAPFTGATAQAIVARLLTVPPTPITQTRSTVPAHVEEAVLTALAKLPADRHSTARDFAAALADSTRVDSSHAHADTRATQPSRRRSQPLTALALGLALVGTAAVSYFAGRSRAVSTGAPIRGFGRATQVSWEPGLEVMPQISPDGKQVAYVAGSSSRMRLYVRPVAGGRATAITDDTNAVETHPRWSRDGSRLLYLSNGRVFSAPAGGGGGRPEVPDRGGAVMSAVWSPDQRRIAFTIGDTLFLRDTDGAVRPLAPVNGGAECAWSARDLVACSSGNPWYLTPGIIFNNLAPSVIVVIRVRDGNVTLVTDSTSSNMVPAWSADGEWLYYLSTRNGPTDLYAQRVTDDGAVRGSPARLTTGLGAQSFSLSADGHRLAYALLTESSNVWSLPLDASSAARAEQITSGQQRIDGISVSRDGAWLYYDSDLAGNGDIYRLRLPSGNPERLTADSINEFAPAVSPDGRQIAFHAFGRRDRDIYSLPLDGGPRAVVAATALQEGLPEWSPDGQSIAFQEIRISGGTYVVRRGRDGRWAAPRRLTNGAFPRWSPDGRQFAYIDQMLGGSLLVMPADSGPSRLLFDGSRPGGLRVNNSAWSDDGRTIYAKTATPVGDAEVWAVDPRGGEPRRLASLGDPRRRSNRFGFAVAKGRMYFTLRELESDVWVMEVDRQPR